MPLNSSDAEDARWDDAVEKYGPLCPKCHGRMSHDDKWCNNCGWEDDDY